MKVEQAAEYFRSALKAGRTAQAFIVAGAPRVEGRETAEKLLAMLFCESASGPCCKCPSCRLVMDNRHPDINWIEPQKKSRTISIEQVRAISQFVFQTSYAGSWKVCVITGADRLSREAANAFLKTLEEPPPKCMFMLLSDSPQLLLPTIVSRCQVLNVFPGERLNEDEWGEKVTKVLASAASAALPDFCAAGGLLKVFGEMKKAAREAIGDTDEDDEKVLQDAREARIEARYRELRTAAVRQVLVWYRDVLMLACGGTESLVYHAKHVEALRKCASSGVRKALENLAVIEDMHRRLGRSMSDDTVLCGSFARTV